MTHGASSLLPPTTLAEGSDGTAAEVAEIRMDPDSDVVLRFVSGNYSGPFLPGYEAPDAESAAAEPDVHFGVRRVDHIGLSAKNERRVINHIERTTGVAPASIVAS